MTGGVWLALALLSAFVVIVAVVLWSILALASDVDDRIESKRGE